MRLLFIRHGHPNYKDNILTELGHRQAEAAAERLMRENIDVIYSSNYGRAVETAEHTARKLGKEVIQLDFIHEISWGLPVEMTKEEKMRYHPWFAIRQYGKDTGDDLLNYDYDGFFAWKGTKFETSNQRVTEGLDKFLEELGYKREGTLFRCVKENNDVVAIFAHAGSLSCACASILGLPAPYFFGYSDMDFTGITEWRFEGAEGERVVPILRYYNDHAHIDGIERIPQE